MRSVFNGSINFGLANINIKLYSATEEHDLAAHQVHAHDHGRIKYKRVCETCDETVSPAEIAKLYELDGQQAILTNEELATLPSENNRVIEVLEFVPAGSIDTVLYDKSYYVGPKDKSATKSYALLTTALRESGKVAIARFTLRSKTRLAALSVTGKNIMVIHALRWPDEVRPAELLDNDVLEHEFSDAEVGIANQLIDSMTTEFNPDRYRDNYRVELRELVLSKVSDEAVDEVSDLLAKLESSIKRSGNAATPVVAEQVNKTNVRQWARAQGIKIGDRGRIPVGVVDRYKEAIAV